MKRLHTTVAAAAVVVLGLAACSSPSADNQHNGGTGPTIGQQHSLLDPTAKGPAAEVPGARKGGTVTVYAQSTPDTFDPTSNYSIDTMEIGKLLFRTPTQFAIRDGRPILVPDLTDLGTVSDDKLTWTFKLRSGIKYADGSPVKVEDLAYAIKRSFAHDVYSSGPTFQLRYFKDGGTYKGPYTGGDTYAGVETPDAGTLVIHLSRPFSDLPFFMSFPMFTPIPKARDTRDQYRNNPVATGPYQFDSFTPGAELKLKRNPNWDPTTDAVRHAYPDAWQFKWGVIDAKNQQQVLNSNGKDANAINYGTLDASLIPQVTGPKANQLIKGASPCTALDQLDSRKIPLEVRKAIAKAWPYDQAWTAGGLNDLTAQRATTIMSPSIPGYRKYPPLPDLTSSGRGDPAAAKQMLQAAGKLGFQLSWYYDNTKPIPQQVSQIRSDALKAAGFTVKPIGVTTVELRMKLDDYNAPVNIGQAPRGWCPAWPSGGNWFPVLFQSHSIADGNSFGMLSDDALDREIDEVSALPADQATEQWGELDQKIMGRYVVLPRSYAKLANVMGTNIGGAEGDSTLGMTFFPNIFLKTGS